jgi:competence protein ComFC
MNQLLQSAKPWLAAALGFVYPEVCQICNHEPATAAEGFVGPLCWQKVRFVTPPFCDRCGLPYSGNITSSFECSNCRDAELHFSHARSAVSATGVVLEVIHRYKYQRALWFEPFLADLLVRAAVPELSGQKFDFIVPVPLHSAKFREREFNQAERLADCLSIATGIPMNKNLLARVKPTQTQTTLSRPKRAKNVQTAFAQHSGAKRISGRVVLVDDVFTTGATTSACAKVLLSLGANDVSVWTVARGL